MAAEISEEEVLHGTSLFTSSDVKWFEIVENQRHLLMQGKLECVMVLHDGQAVLMINVGSSWVANQSVRICTTKSVPSMRAGPGVYMFHNEDGYYGLQFGSTVADDKIHAFEQILMQFSAFSVAEDVLEHSKEDTNYKVVNASDTGVKYVQKGTHLVTESINTLSKQTSRGIKWATGFMKKHIKTNEEETVVSENLKWQAQKVRQAGGAAVTLSKSLVTGAVSTASSISHSIYEQGHTTNTGSKVEKAMSGPKAQAAAKVAVVSANAAWEIYLAMAQAGVNFVEDVTEATAEVVEHKYGHDAGEVARDGLSAISSGVQALNTVNNAAYTAVMDGVVGKQTENVIDNAAQQHQANMLEDTAEDASPAAASTAALSMAATSSASNVTVIGGLD